jgi:hypothetical protein
MDRDFWFKFEPALWQRGKVRQLSMVARAFWLECLCFANDSDRPGFIQNSAGHPLSLDQLAATAGCSSAEAEAALREIREAGIGAWTKAGVLYSPRMVGAKQLNKARKNAGRKGGNANGLAILLKQNESKSQANGLANPSSSSSLAFSSHSCSLEGDKKGCGEEKGKVADGFDEFWAAYPKHVKKARALEQWLHLGPDPPLREKILQSIAQQQLCDQWQEDRYIPDPHNWLKDRGWEDEHAPNTVKGAKNGRQRTGRAGRKDRHPDDMVFEKPDSEKGGAET